MYRGPPGSGRGGPPGCAPGGGMQGPPPGGPGGPPHGMGPPGGGTPGWGAPGPGGPPMGGPGCGPGGGGGPPGGGPPGGGGPGWGPGPGGPPSGGAPGGGGPGGGGPGWGPGPGGPPGGGGPGWGHGPGGPPGGGGPGGGGPGWGPGPGGPPGGGGPGGGGPGWGPGPGGPPGGGPPGGGGPGWGAGPGGPPGPGGGPSGPPPWGPPVNPPKPPTDGPKPPIDGPKPPTDGPKPPTDGPKPPTDGPKPPTDGPKPPTDGPKPPVDGPKPPTDGPKPPTDGPKPPVDGPKPPTDGPKPPTDGPKPPTDGPKPPTDGPKPPTDGPKPPTDGPKPPTDGPKPPTDGPKPPTDWPKPPTDGPKPPTDGPKPPTDGPKPPTDGPKPPTDGPKPPVNCPKPPVDCSKPPVDCLKPPVDCSKPPVDVSKPPVDSPTPTYNLKNIQGDILPSLPKALEYFYYFEITNLAKFRDTFGMFIVPKITTSHQIASNPQLPPPGTPGVTFLGLNVGFTHLALQMFGMTGNLLDDSFEKGQQQDSKSLGDAGTQRGNFWTPQWDAEYKADIHGIFLITAYEDAIAAKFVADMEKAFSYTASRMSIKKVVLLKATPRPKPEDRNDHFGYRGGMSNPQIRGASFETTQVPKIRYPGSPIIPIGVIVMGYDGDEDKDKRPAWAKDGSFMVTRKLNNLVPEFDEFLLLHGPKIFLNISAKDAADRLGARLFGRWKDGTPTELSPDGPNPDISGKDDKVNNFVFDQSKGQTRCPFASHVRKSNPRNDVSPIESAYKHFIRRHNMPYGQEITAEEREGKSTIFERGLHVVCYASSIVRGFKFYQQAWYNEPNFPPGKSELPGQDPIFGQTGQEHLDNHRYMTGTNPTAEQQVMMFPKKFIDVKGGEYFFAPSISTMRDMIATQVYLG